MRHAREWEQDGTLLIAQWGREHAFLSIGGHTVVFDGRIREMCSPADLVNALRVLAGTASAAGRTLTNETEVREELQHLTTNFQAMRATLEGHNAMVMQIIGELNGGREYTLEELYQIEAMHRGISTGWRHISALEKLAARVREAQLKVDHTNNRQIHI